MANSNTSGESPSSQAPWLTFYGDDFTGSTDVMDAMAGAGLSTVLFLSVPTDDLLARFAGYQCVGWAGLSRRESPEWMRQHLPAIFDKLWSLGAPILQYKVCSTFDSSPTCGSIGCAMEIGLSKTQTAWAPVVVGVPQLRRYQIFGHLFATVGQQTHRLDRHPTMSRHPVTPMAEADLLVHLGQQTELPMALVDWLSIRRDDFLADWEEREQANRSGAVFLDVMDELTQSRVGEALWSSATRHRRFVVGSSGVNHALASHWRHQQRLSAPVWPAITSAHRSLVISGSCSPVTAEQIRKAPEDRFFCFGLTHDLILDQSGALVAWCAQVLEQISEGKIPLIYSAMGPDDQSLRPADPAASVDPLETSQWQLRIASTLAKASALLMQMGRFDRLIVAGGDTSGAVVTALNLDALTVKAPLVPGAPLCEAWRKGDAAPAFELVLKGGQMGGPDFFRQAAGV